MFFVSAFLGYLLLVPDKQRKAVMFFDLNTTGSLRGIWALVVLMVHIPSSYQNPVQDMIGSFAYVGVTFFFMTSGYGLFLSMEKKPNFLKNFWRKRLPGLLLPMLISNIVFVVAKFWLKLEWSFQDVFMVTGWVKQLLIFYGIFWIIYGVLPETLPQRSKTGLFIAAIALFSITAYAGWLSFITVWPTESFGFIYGALLYRYRDHFVRFATSGWVVKCAVACVLSAVTGVGYLMLKHWVFFGDYLLKILLGALILLLLLLWNAKKPIGNYVAKFLGSISYEIYLLHGAVFVILQACRTDWNSGVFVASSILVTVLIATAVHTICAHILKKE